MPLSFTASSRHSLPSVRTQNSTGQISAGRASGSAIMVRRASGISIDQRKEKERTGAILAASARSGQGSHSAG